MRSFARRATSPDPSLWPERTPTRRSGQPDRQHEAHIDDLVDSIRGHLARPSPTDGAARPRAPPVCFSPVYGTVRKPSLRKLQGPRSSHTVPLRPPPVIWAYWPVPRTTFQVPVPT